MTTKQSRLYPMLRTNRNRARALGVFCLSIVSSACDVEPAEPQGQLAPENQAGSEGENNNKDKNKDSNSQQPDTDPKNDGDDKNKKKDTPANNPAKDNADNKDNKGNKGGKDGKGGKDNKDDKKGNSPSEDDAPHLQYIVITPGDQVVEQDLGKSSTLEYKAIGYYSNGKSEDVSEKAQWEISDSAVGSFNEDTLTLAPHNKLFVQTTTVTAKIDKVESRSQLTVTAYEQDGDNPDFVFILPYKDKAGAKERVLSFQTKIPSMDVFFSFDSTASMSEEREKLLSSINSTIVPTIHSKIPNTQFGVGSVQDFPVAQYGERTDQPFLLLSSITPDVDTVKKGISSMKMGDGWDHPESIFEGLYQVATGEGLSGPGETKVAPNNEGIGGVGFRAQTMPVIISVTDAPSHGKDEKDECERKYTGDVAKVAHSYKETAQALNKICARVITVASDGTGKNEPEACRPSYDGKRLAHSTKTRVSPVAWDGQRPKNCAKGQCCTGINGAGQAPESDGLCPLVFNIDTNGAGLDASVVSGIEALAFYAPLNVIAQSEGKKTSQSGQALDQGATTTRFIQKLLASGFSDLPRQGLPEPTIVDDRFEKVTPGTKVKFTIRAFNDFVEPTGKPQVFRAKIRVKADQCQGLDLDEREVVFVVPPRALVAG